MTLPGEVIAGRFYMVTRRCTQRQCLLRPDKETNNAFIYCLAEAAQRFGIDGLLPSAMANHHHTVIYDRQGTVPGCVWVRVSAARSRVVFRSPIVGQLA